MYHTTQNISSLVISCITEHLCHNVYNMIQLIASHVSHSIYNIMCTIWYNSLHHMHQTASMTPYAQYNTTHIITGHLMYHRASMAQCVQYGTTHCITYITQHLWHHMHNIIKHISSLVWYSAFQVVSSIEKLGTAKQARISREGVFLAISNFLSQNYLIFETCIGT